MISNTFRVYDATTGRFQREVPGISSFSGTSLINGKIITTGDSIEAYDTDNDEIAWETASPGGGIETPLTPSDSVLYGASETGYVFALNLSSGDILWTSRIDDSTTQRSPVILGSTVWICADNGEVFVLMKETGEEAFSIAPPTNNTRDRPLRVLNDVIYLGGYNPVAYTLDI